MPSYKLGVLSRQLGIHFRSAAHRAESDAEVGAELLNHIGRHLGTSYGMDQVDSQLLVSVNKLSAAKVSAFLDKYASAKKSASAD
jgi:DNA polymerase-3 subunit epsilon